MTEWSDGEFRAALVAMLVVALVIFIGGALVAWVIHGDIWRLGAQP